MAYFPEDVKIEVVVVDGVQDGRRDLVALEEVAEVGPAEGPAGVAAAGLVEGPFVPRLLGEAVDLPPLIVMTGVIVGASVGGILGALLATPVI